MEQTNTTTKRNTIKGVSQAVKKTNSIYLSISLKYPFYEKVRSYTIENDINLSTVIENFLKPWLKMKQKNVMDKKIIKDYIIKGKGSVLNKTPFNPDGTAVLKHKSQFNITLDIDLMRMIKEDPKFSELNISAMCNKFLWSVYKELHKDELKKLENEGV